MKKEININKIAEKSVCLEWFEMEGDLLAVTSEGVCKISKSSYLNKTCYNVYMEYDDRTPSNSFLNLEDAKEWVRTMYVDNVYSKITNVIGNYNAYNKSNNIISVK
jgi:hypothetical protein